MPWLEESLNRMPVLANLGIQREVHGAISHPPDGNPLIGPAASVRLGIWSGPLGDLQLWIAALLWL